ncbi:auxin efflux carrier transmembrane protein [Mycena pura]|uniref:Auxin efflux carrier transmembrane protein n=1 Tax=Mycena pura TaxID=153505 RepID=A0AAD6V3T5_9AGAR|nr:auxin efflux carrier transmembrane protein [Mycena pura]
MLTAGYLIWISCRPLFRLIICVSSGFAITKADLFPAVAARGTGQVLLNITLPSLMFSKIVPAFNSQNIGALGSLILVGFIYEGMGIVLAWLVSRFFWVPHRFRWGMLVAGGWGNYGDIPVAVVMSITGARPFNGTSDQTLSVAYVAGFLFVRLIGLDYVGPDVEPEEVQEATRLRRKLILYEWPTKLVDLLMRRRWDSKSAADKQTAGLDGEKRITPDPEKLQRAEHDSSKHDSVDTAVLDGTAESSTFPHLVTPQAPTTAAVDTVYTMHRQATPTLPTAVPRTATSSAARRHTFSTRLRTFLRNLLIPSSVAILASFVIALVPPLKALFVPVESWHIHPAPDGQPPLAFVLDTATFIGAASVPMGLFCLGSALARLSVPRGAWGSLPTGAILGLAITKMLVSPVLGVLICKGLVNVGFIDSSDKVLQFVCIFFSCLPTATTQVFVTQVYSGTGSAEHLSAFLIPQYILMLPSMTALTAYTLRTLF